MWSSPAYSYVGDAAEARRRAEQAIRLSPFDPHLFLRHTALALALYTSGEFEEAASWGRKALSQNPRYTAVLRIFIASLAAAGRIDEARAAAQTFLEQEPTFRIEAYLPDLRVQGSRPPRSAGEPFPVRRTTRLTGRLRGRDVAVAQ